MKKLILLLIFLATIVFTPGCIESSVTSQENPEKNAVLVVAQLEQINTSLEKNPVFLRMGSRWCPHCRAMKPILEKMAAEYTGNATIAAIDVDKSQDLAKYFGAQMIPDSCVILGIQNGKYVYMQEDGNISLNRSQARFIGFNETAGPNEEMFKKVLDLALIQKVTDKYK
jgi:thioredoxin 1